MEEAFESVSARLVSISKNMCSIFVDNTVSSGTGSKLREGHIFGLERAAFKVVLQTHGRRGEGEMAR